MPIDHLHNDEVACQMHFPDHSWIKLCVNRYRYIDLFHWFCCHCDCCFCLHNTSVVQFCPTLSSIITSPSRPSFSFSSKISSRHTMPSVEFCSSSRHRHFRCRHRHQPRPRSPLSFFSLLLTFLLSCSFSMCGYRSGFYPNCTFLETSSACKSTTWSVGCGRSTGSWLSASVFWPAPSPPITGRLTNLT